MKLSSFLKKIRKAQFKHRDLVYWSLGIILFVILFLQFLILPAGRRARQLEEEMTSKKKHYEEVLRGKSLDQVILFRQKELMALEKKFSRHEKISGILTILSKKANELGIQVISVRPEPAVPYPNKENPIDLEGEICEALSIQMNIRCSYRVLGGFLESLEEEFPSALTVDGLDIRKEEGKDSLLKVNLVVTAYLFGSST